MSTTTIKENINNITNKTKENAKNIGNIAKENIKNILNKSKDVDMKTILIYVFFTSVIIYIIYYLYKRYKRKKSKDLDNILDNPLTYSLWTKAPISTLGMYKTKSKKILIPEPDNIINYGMHLNINDWTHGYGMQSGKELFNHGESTNCCNLGNNDIINVEFDDKLNNIRITLVTNQSCDLNTDDFDVKSFCIGKDDIFGIFQNATGGRGIYRKNNNSEKGDNCWYKVTIEDFPGDSTLIDVRVIDINISVTKTPNYKTMIFLLSSKELGGYSFGLLRLKNEDETYVYSTMKESINSLLIDNAKTKQFALASKSINSIYVFFKDEERKTKYLEYNLETHEIKDETYWVETNVSDEKVSQLPFESGEHLWIRTETKEDNKPPSDNNKTLYKCKKPCMGENSGGSTPIRNYETEELKYEFKSMTIDLGTIWGLEKSTNKIFKKSFVDSSLSDENSWEYGNVKSVTSPRGTLPNVSDIYTNPHMEEEGKLWGILNDSGKNKIKKTNKCGAVFTNSCGIKENMKTTETVTIENVPIGKPFHLLITVTPKRIDVYIDGFLNMTKILKGKRSSELKSKQFRFFGSSTKVDGIVSHFRYIPFFVNMETLRKLVEHDSKNKFWLKKCK
jgi:hypothetical protein